MNFKYSQIFQTVLLLAGYFLSGCWLVAQAGTGDLLIVDAGNNRILQFDTSSGVLSEAFNETTIAAVNGHVAPALSGGVFYDSYQSYLYLSGSGGSARLYRVDIGSDVSSLAVESELLGLQSFPEDIVDLTGMATPLGNEILVTDRGLSEGSIYRIDLISGEKTLLASEEDYLGFSGSNGIGMTHLEFRALFYDSLADGYCLLSGGNGEDGGANVRSVLYKTDSNGQPQEEFAVSAIDADWKAMVPGANGKTYIVQELGGSISIVVIDATGTVSTLLDQAGLDTIFGSPVILAPSLSSDSSGLLYLMSLDGVVYLVDPSNPFSLNSQVVSAQDYIDDTGTAVTDALGLAHVPLTPVSHTVTEASDPSGYVAESSVSVIENRPYTVSNPNIVQGNFRLGFWSLNGVRQAAASGRGLFQPTFTVTGDTDAVAQYYNINLDGDGDRLGDWWEFWMFGDRTRGPQDDDDEDGFDHETEFTTGYDATITDISRYGGIAARQSVQIKFNDSNKVRLRTQSEPFGLIADTEVYYDSGTFITSDLYSFSTQYNGHSFTHWTVNSVRVNDSTGLPRRRVIFEINSDADIVAHFTLSTADTDSDGILDYKELRIAENLTLVSPGSNLDGDGYTVAEEQANGYSSNLHDVIRPGGIASRQSVPITFVVGKSLYTEDSLPFGIIPSVSEYVDDGTIKTTAYRSSSLASGLEFAYWSVNGSALRDPTGVALRQITSTVTGRTDVKAHFFSPTVDSDVDGIVDVDEWRFFEDLSKDRTSNPDGDSFTIGQELENGYSMTVADEARPGGVASRQSVKITFNDSEKVLLTSQSEPFGLMANTKVYHDLGTEIISSHYNFGQAISGHYFTHWTINGERVEDVSGMSRRQAIFDITSDTELVAHFTLSSADADDDGIPDFRELRIAEDPTLLTVSPGSDLDTDGLTVAEEQANGYSELLDDAIRPGGISARMSVLSSVNLESAPSDINLTNVTIFEGQPVGTVVGTFITTANNPDDTFTYAFAPGLGSNDNGRFRIDGDLLVADEVLDFAMDSILNIRVKVTDSNGDSYEKDLLVFVLEDLTNTYQEFVAETFSPFDRVNPLISGPDIDFDGDGLVNFEEYVHARNPFVGDGEQLEITFASFGTPATVRAAQLTFPWRDGMTDAAYTLEKSVDLTGWTPVLFSILEKITIDGISKVSIEVVQSFPHPDKEFFQLVPTSTATQPAVIDIASGDHHTLFLKADGSAWAVGQNSVGQIGDGTVEPRPVPVQVMTDVVEIAAGSDFSLFRKSNGTVWAAGSNEFGQFGNGTTSPQVTTPVQVQTGVLGIDAGVDHSLFLMDDFTAWAAGIDNWGQLGDGSSGVSDFSSTTAQVLTNVRDVSAQGYTSFFIRNDDTLWGTGRNTNGQLGNGSTVNLSTPVQVATDVAMVTGGLNHSLVLKNTGVVLASGKNDFGQLGDGANPQELNPITVMTDVSWVGAGVHSSFLITNEGWLLATGLNDFGQLGDGSEVDRFAPVLVLGSGYVATGGLSHSYFLEDNATVWAVGRNNLGQLGDGSNSDTSEPVEVESFSTTP